MSLKTADLLTTNVLSLLINSLAVIQYSTYLEMTIIIIVPTYAYIPKMGNDFITLATAGTKGRIFILINYSLGTEVRK